MKYLLLCFLILTGCDHSSLDKYKENCQKLDIKFGDKVTIRYGFFKGVKMKAIGKDNFHVKVQFLEGLNISEESFMCGDIEKL